MSIVNLTSTRVGASQNRNMLTGVDVQTSKILTGDSNYLDHIFDDSIDVTVGVFFDGTLNNRYNAQAGVESKRKQAGENYNAKVLDHFIADSDESTSFYNDESNISRLEPYYKETNEEKHKTYKIYIDGIGTEAYDEDSTVGFALGQGPTGIKGKVEIGCKEVAKKITKAVSSTQLKKVNTLTIDSYGFSRGAAAARHFISELYKTKGEIKAIYGSGMSTVIIYYDADGGILGEELQKKGITVKRLVVRFVGLYDTVTSLGLPWFHKMNDKSLHLNAIRKARKVVHLTAGDEHRSNFVLTNIKSASNGKEIELPGVHSDIGGGYVDGASEKVKLNTSHFYLPPLRKERLELIEQGWYKPDEIRVDNMWGTLWGERASISNKYSYIPLQMMCKFSVETGNIPYKKTQLENAYYVGSSDILTLAKLTLFSYAFNNGSTIPENEALIKSLRNKFFHFSAHYNGALDSMSPSFKNGKREREVFDG